MRHKLYEFFGLPKIPSVDVEDEPQDAVLEAEPVPINIPQPVQPKQRIPVHELHFHDLGEKKWLEWSSSRQPLPRRGLRYLKPDQMNRLPLDGIATRLSQGDILVFDFSILAHMDSQRAALARQVQDVAGMGGLPVFALDDAERLLLVPGRGTRIDTETHELGEASTPIS